MAKWALDDGACRELALLLIEDQAQGYVRALRNAKTFHTFYEWQKLTAAVARYEAWFRGVGYGQLNYFGTDPEWLIQQCKKAAGVKE